MKTPFHTMFSPLLAITAIPALGAQAPTVSANVTSPLTVNASGTFLQSTPIGPLPPAGVTLSAATMGGTANLLCGPTGGHPANVAGFELRTSGQTFPNFFQAASFAIDGTLVLQLTTPTPTAVLIALRGASSGFGATLVGRTDVDLDNDGSIDFSVVIPTNGSSTMPAAEAGVLVDAAGRQIRIVHHSLGAWNGFGTAPSMQCDLDLTFHAGVNPIVTYGPACIPLTWTRNPSGDAILQCPSPTGAPVFFLTGFNALQLPLPFPPGCNLLTDIVLFDVVAPSGGLATRTLPNYALPPGISIYVQAGVFEPTGNVRTSNGLRVTGPS